ncbi:MAG: hypothetical protein HYS57_01375 [Parcubacteria group bacterium]|nr:hypothetical protein [Parcubacteria group bacterium]
MYKLLLVTFFLALVGAGSARVSALEVPASVREVLEAPVPSLTPSRMGEATTLLRRFGDLLRPAYQMMVRTALFERARDYYLGWFGMIKDIGTPIFQQWLGYLRGLDLLDVPGGK